MQQEQGNAFRHRRRDDMIFSTGAFCIIIILPHMLVTAINNEDESKLRRKIGTNTTSTTSTAPPIFKSCGSASGPSLTSAFNWSHFRWRTLLECDRLQKYCAKRYRLGLVGVLNIYNDGHSAQAATPTRRNTKCVPSLTDSSQFSNLFQR